MNKQIMKLHEEIEVGRKEIKTDSISMSIGEAVSLYENKDIDLSPVYQRLYRWEDHQKTRFLESIILGIPLPPIFVAQGVDGVWSVVDGLQRLSSILEIMGVLVHEGIDGKKSVRAELKLTSTKKLKSLEGLTWRNLPIEIQRLVRRARLNFNIILTENSIHAQYELFQRLNTGGLKLEPQEVRNCLITMLDRSFYELLNQLKLYSSFHTITNLTGRQQQIEMHMELVLRYFINKCNKINFTNYSVSTGILSEFIDDETTYLIENIQKGQLNLEKEVEVFKRTFDLLSNIDSKVFSKYYENEDKFKGAFVISNFEAITSGVASNIDYWVNNLPLLETRIKEMHSNEEYQRLTARGIRALTRAKGMISFSIDYFKP